MAGVCRSSKVTGEMKERVKCFLVRLMECLICLLTGHGKGGE